MSLTHYSQAWIVLPTLACLAWIPVSIAQDEMPPIPVPTQPDAPSETSKTSESPNVPKAGETTQELLQKFREEIEELNKRFSREDQENTRRTLAMNAKTKYQTALQSSIIPDKSIEHHFDQLMENIDLARRSFRFRDADRARSDWIVEATHLMQREIRGAKDLKKDRSAQGWFEEYLQLMVRLRDKVGNDLVLARRLYSTCNNIFGLVYREIDVQPEKNASEILESNLRLIKRFFPTATEEQKSKNDSLARTMERNATQIFKDQTKAK